MIALNNKSDSRSGESVKNFQLADTENQSIQENVEVVISEAIQQDFDSRSSSQRIQSVQKKFSES